MRRTTLGWTLALLLLAGGCAGLTDLSISARNRSAAYKAWRTARWDYWNQGVPHKMREHIGRGFQQGYYDVANGGSGQLPLFPPGYYWGPEYQNPQGNELIAAWFRGYTDGALAADRSGIGGYHNLPTSWAPPYASDPDSPDGGFTPAPNSGAPGAPGTEVPPGINGAPPQFPLPPQVEEVLPPLPLEKPVSVPILPPGDSQPPIGIPHVGTVPPALTMPPTDAEVKPSEPTRVTPEEETSAGKQTATTPELSTPSIVPALTPEILGAAPELEPARK